MSDEDTNSDNLSGDELDPDDYVFIESFDDEIEPAKEMKKKKKATPEYDLIRAALESHLHEYAMKKKDQKRNLEQLTSIIEEFLSSFILLGYNYDGESVTLVSSSTQQQSDSLSTLLHKFIATSSPPGDHSA